MIFKRKEAFRFVFDTPIDVKFALPTEKGILIGKILDISPSGMKIEVEREMAVAIVNRVRLEAHFIIDTILIQSVGEIVWSRPLGRISHFGIQLKEEPSIQELIVSELKSFRRKAVLGRE